MYNLMKQVAIITLLALIGREMVVKHNCVKFIITNVKIYKVKVKKTLQIYNRAETIFKWYPQNHHGILICQSGKYCSNKV